MFGVPTEAVTKQMRSHAKAVNFGIVYGISAFSLAQDIGVSVYEAKEYIQNYLDRFSGVRRYMTEIVEKAKAQGYVETLMHRRRDLPELTASNFATRSFGERVALMKMIPGADCGMLSYLLEHNDAVIIESFGVGGLPGGEHGEMFAALRRWCESGRLAVFTTQVPHEGCDLAVYEVGRAVGELPGVLEARDMTPEAVAVKLMWALGQTEDREKAARLFETPIEYDIM